jgi:hypothetical protein
MPPAKKARAKRRELAPLTHPPRGANAQAYRRVLELALALPGVEDSRAYGTPCIKVKGKVMARLRSEAEGALALRCDFPEREMLMQADPDTFFLTDHYRDWPMVLVRLDRVRWAAMPGLIEAAWRLVAPKRLIAQHDAPAR